MSNRDVGLPDEMSGLDTERSTAAQHEKAFIPDNSILPQLKGVPGHDYYENFSSPSSEEGSMSDEVFEDTFD